jgi:hypothetical protein
MKPLLVLALFLTAFGLLVAAPGAGTTAAQSAGVCPDNPDPPDAADPSVIVDTPTDGDRITSPVTISGRARVFEANVSITIFDANGNELVETFTTAAEAGPVLAPYSAQVAFTTTTEQKGCVRVFEASAQDGRPTNVVQVEVTLAPPGTRPPTTGDAGLGNDRSGDNLALYAAGALLVLGAAALALKRRAWD